MDWIKILTPKDTEEIKPGLYVQKTRSGYKTIAPACWDGKINYYNLFLGPQFVKGIIWFTILMLLVYGYTTSTKSCEEFQADPCKYLPNITDYCMKQNSYDNSIDSKSGEDGEYTYSLSGDIQQVP